MRPFLSPPVDAPPSAPRVTAASRVRQVLSSGAWFTRRQVAAATGLPDGVVNTAIHAELRHGRVEREVPELGTRQKTITQRYRATGGGR